MNQVSYSKENNKLELSVSIDNSYTYLLTTEIVIDSGDFNYSIRAFDTYDDYELVNISNTSQVEICKSFNLKFPDYMMSIHNKHKTLEIHHKIKSKNYTHKIILVYDESKGIFTDVFEISEDTAMFVEEQGGELA